MKCSVEDCDRKSRAKGMCSLHYYRVKRNGSTDVIMQKGKTFEEMYGVEKAKDIKTRISVGHMGLKSVRAGKTYQEEYGVERAKEITSKMSETRTGMSYASGRIWTEEEKEHMRKLAIARGCKPPIHRGENNPNWKGGISKEEYTENWTDILKESIRCRDHYMCRLCGKHQDKVAHDVHHIDYVKKHCDPNNLITLCKSCHMKTSYKREDWKELFRRLDNVFGSDMQEVLNV